MSRKKKRKLCAVLFADIANYTALMQRDEELASGFLQKFRDSLQKYTRLYEGEIIQFYGDGCLCVFNSSVHAVGCAKDLQITFRALPQVPVRIGLHSGDVFFEADNVYGDSVNLASRIESVGSPGSVLISERIANDLRNHPDFRITYLGEFSLKNVQTPTKIFALTNEGLVVPQTLQSAKALDQVTSIKKSSIKHKKILWGSGMLAVLILAVYLLSSFFQNNLPSFSGESTVAVLPFENNTGDESFNIVGKMATDRIVHGITQNDLASVITDETLEEYDKLLIASPTPTDPIARMRRQFDVSEVINGHIYVDQEDLIFECTISDAKSKKVVKGLEAVRSPKTNPMQGIEKVRQLVMGFLASRQDRALDLLLETHVPKLAAYQELELAKASEDEERELLHLNRAIEIDSNYFEPKVLRLSWYYNAEEFTVMDSLRNEIRSDPLQSDRRQQNLLNFYDALLDGKNDLVFQFMHREYAYAPFHLETNTTMIVLALQFIHQIKEALNIYQKIPAKRLDYANCDNCRVRLYLKAYIDMEMGQYQRAVETSQQLYKYGRNAMGLEVLINSHAWAGQFEELQELIASLEGDETAPSQAGLYLDAAKACVLAGNSEEADNFSQKAGDKIIGETHLFTVTEIHLIRKDWKKCTTALHRLLKTDPSNQEALAYLAGIELKKGNAALAERYIEQLNQLRKPYQFGIIDYRLAQAYAIGNDIEASLTHLKKSAGQGQRFNFGQFHHDVIFHSLRDDKAFKEIIEYWQ